MAIKIVTDSTAYLPTTLLKELDIQVVSLNIIMDQCSAREVEIDLCDFYENLATQNTLPTSSQPSLEEFFDVFKCLTDEGHEVIGIFLSSKMSGTYSSAHLVKEMVLEQNKAAKIHIIGLHCNTPFGIHQWRYYSCLFWWYWNRALHRYLSSFIGRHFFRILRFGCGMAQQTKGYA